MISIMPLSTKLRAEYAELIAQSLDNIPIDSLEDFDSVHQALQNIIRPAASRHSIAYTVPEKYKDRMFAIKDHLQDPGDYVEHERDYDEYKQIIRDRITSKIQELQSFDSAQKEAYIQNQHDRRSQTTVNQEIMAQHMPPEPESDRHVLTEQQWHAQQQGHFQSELYQNEDQPLLESYLTHEEIQLMVDSSNGRYTTEDFAGITAEDLDGIAAGNRASKFLRPGYFVAVRDGLFPGVDFTRITAGGDVFFKLWRPKCIEAIREGLFTVEDCIRITDGNVRSQFLRTECIEAIREGLFTAVDFTRITDGNVASQLLRPECLAAIREGLFTGADFTEITIGDVAYQLMEPECLAAIREGLFTGADFAKITIANIAYQLMEPECLAAIREGLFTAKEFAKITDDKLAYQLVQPECLAAIRERHTTIDQLLDMTADALSNANRTGEYPNSPRFGV